MKNKYGEIRSGIAIVVALLVTFGGAILLSILIQAIFSQIASERTAVAFNLAGIVFLYAWQIAATFVCFSLLYRRPIREMGFTANGAVSLTVMGLAFGALSIAAAAALLVATGQAVVTDTDPSRMLSSPFWFGLVQFILVGFYEELACRGYMMTALKTTRNKYLIMLFPAGLFSLLHIFNANVTFFSLVNIALVGILFAYLFVKTGSLWAPIGYHISWNFVQGHVLGIAVSGTDREGVSNIVFTGAKWLTGGAFGVEGGAACTAALLLGLAYIHFCIKTPLDDQSWTLESGLPLVRRT